MKYRFFISFSLLLFAFSCGQSEKNHISKKNKLENDGPLFTLLDSEETNVHFNNKLTETEEMNYMDYEYFYNGGGVAIGDVNGDGLSDLFFTANMTENHLYLNEGNLKFKDISSSAGISQNKGWSTGVSMADVNADGLIDIYVCRSGKKGESNRENLLYINNGDLTFSESAEAYGLNDNGFSTNATFFDYDRDGDLDMYLVNYAVIDKDRSFFSFDQLKSTFDPDIGDKLFRNDNGHFTDVSKEAGIKQNAIGFGLSVATGDVNNDGWPDMYVTNDYTEHDYFYINNKDGSFSEMLKQTTQHISNFSMGSDMADFNNDGWLDIMIVDMVAEDNFRQKTNMSGMNPKKFWRAVDKGFFYQYMMNTLQLNNGNGTFSEVARLGGMSNTDWSWAPLFADFDNDGHKDLFITNGQRKDGRNNDFSKLIKKRNLEIEKKGKFSKKERWDLLAVLLDSMPSQKISNYIYKNNGDLSFEKNSINWGIDEPSFSNGGAYADLDNDGDLDLVVNNIDMEAFIYRNNSSEISVNNYLRIKLKGSKGNDMGIGSRVNIKTEDGEQMQELYLARGFQSSVEGILHFGLKDIEKVKSLEVTWPDGKKEVLKNINANQAITLEYKNAKEAASESNENKPTLFTQYTPESKISFKHIENIYDDFKKESLLPHRMSTLGPALAVGDVNGDQLEDFYIGGASGQSGQLFLQKEGGQFMPTNPAVWEKDQAKEDSGAAFFDADNDGDMDLYIASGGSAVEPDDANLQDRLYLNDGKGNFQKTKGALPKMLTSAQCVAPADFDKDGDIDLFVGGRLIPGKYPFSPRSYLLLNENGKFKDVTEQMAPDLMSPGLVTSALWSDFDKDGFEDLIITGEWMPILFCKNTGSSLSVLENGLADTEGWWFSLTEGDFDGDGDMDYVAGNMGLNYKYHASKDEPFQVFCDDFDENGTLDIVLGYYWDGKAYPVRGRQCSSEQMPFIKEDFENYQTFGNATLVDIYKEEGLENALHKKATTFASAYIENKGKDGFEFHLLPNEAQISSVNGIVAHDFNGDGFLDITISGNLYDAEVETPRSDASIGLFLTGNGKGEFTPVSVNESGFFAPGNVKNMKAIKLGDTDLGILVARSNGGLQILKWNEEQKLNF